MFLGLGRLEGWIDGEVGRDWGGGGWYCGVSGKGYEVWWDGVMGMGR